MKLDKFTGRKSSLGLKSALEQSVWKGLRLLLANTKVKLSYEGCHLPYVLRRRYTPDFILEDTDGKILYIEAKGYLRATDRTKLLAVKRDNPDVDLRIIFQKNNKLNKRSTMRYTDWAEKHGIPHAVGEIPDEWINSLNNS